MMANTIPRDIGRSLTLLATLVLVVVACGGEEADPATSPDVSPSPSASPVHSTPEAFMTGEGGGLCAAVTAVDEHLVSLRAVQLRLPNRVALDIEFDKLQAAFLELEETDTGELEDQLEAPLTRLGYRLGELELAVEDFRTNSRIRRAVPHVEEDAKRLADELGAFVILSRC